MEKIQIIILAAGKGKRMKNEELPKVLAILKGKPMIQYLLESIKKSEVCSKPAIVVGHRAELVKETLGPDYTYIFQAEQLGTGHAVSVCKKELEDKAENILILYGDHPFVSAETIKKITSTHLAGNQVLTMATVTVPDFNDWRHDFAGFGRIVRDQDDKIKEIVENKDATNQQKEIKELNPSYFCFKAEWLWQNLDKLKNNNAQGEYYLTDLIGLAVEQDQEIVTIEIEPRQALGVNTAEQMELLEKVMA